MQDVVEVAVCTHAAARYAPTLAPVPCPECGGWVDRDGTVMDRAATLARFPWMRAQVDAMGAGAPDYAGPSGSERFWRAHAASMQLSRALLGIIFALAALAVLAVVLVALLGVL